jgi:hypothetical protein
VLLLKPVESVNGHYRIESAPSFTIKACYTVSCRGKILNT